jgi:hypothetical protein
MRWLHFTLAALLAAGCSAVTSTDPLPGTSGPPGTDAGGGGRDAGGPGIDAGVPPGDDGGTPVDASACTPGDSWCEGDVLVACRSEGLLRESCAARGDFCTGDPARCEDRVCEPGTSRCDESLTRLLTCDGRGSAESEMLCELGCDPDGPACRDAVPACLDVPEIGPGVHNFTTCGQGNDTSQIPGGDCGGTMANGEDLIFRFTLTRETDVVVDLRDDDPYSGIDTLAYIRRACDDAGSQVACDDDVPCTTSDVPEPCMSGVQVRQSRIVTRLPAGTYYLVVDSFDYRTGSGAVFGCGRVRLSFAAGTSITPG